MLEEARVASLLAHRALTRGSRAGLFLNIVIIALVYTNMILLPSIISGSVQLFNQQTIDYQTSDVTITPGGDRRFIQNSDEVLETVNRIPGVERASARYALGATLNSGAKSVSIPVVAFDPDDEVEVTRIHERMRDGDFLGRGDIGEIILGGFVSGSENEEMDFFDSLGGVEAGESIEVIYSNGVTRNYNVKGIFETKSYQVDYLAFVTWDEMDAVLGRHNTDATEILVRTAGPEAADEVKINLLSYGVQEDVKTWREGVTRALEESIETFSIINSISMMVSLVIAIVVLFIVITIKTLNNRKQIGILKAIGIHRRIIISSYVMQVLFICAIGIILGLVMVQGLSVYFTLHPLEFPDGDVTPHFETIALFTNAVWLLFASAFAGYIPAWRVVRENILDAMRI